MGRGGEAGSSEGGGSGRDGQRHRWGGWKTEAQSAQIESAALRGQEIRADEERERKARRHTTAPVNDVGAKPESKET